MIAFSDNLDDRGGGPSADAGPPGAVAMLVDADLPLDVGLRALSGDVPSRRLRRVLRRMSDELAAGESPDEVLSRRGRGLPRYIRRLIRAGVQSGQLGTFLSEFLLLLVRRRRALGELLLLVALFLLFLPVLCGLALVLSGILSGFRQIYEDFGIELPVLTRLLMQVTDLSLLQLMIGGLGAVLFVVLLLTAMRYVIGPPAFKRAYQRIPLIGTNSRMRNLSEFCSLLGLLVSGNVPLPDALEIASGALQDANLKAGSRKLAARSADGDTLFGGASGMPHFPPELRNLFRWETRGAAFGEMLRQAGLVYFARSRVQLGLIWLIIPTLTLLLVGGAITLTVIGLFLPLIKLLSELS